MNRLLVMALLISTQAGAECPDFDYLIRSSIISHDGNIVSLRSANRDHSVTLSELPNRETVDMRIKSTVYHFIIMLKQNGENKVAMWTKVANVQCKGNEFSIDKNQMNPPQLYDLKGKINSVKIVDTCKSDAPIKEVKQVSLEFVTDAKVAEAPANIVLNPLVEAKNCAQEKTRAEKVRATINRILSPSPDENSDAVSLH